MDPRTSEPQPAAPGAPASPGPRRRRRWAGALLALVLLALLIGGSWYLVNRPAANGAGVRGPGGPGARGPGGPGGPGAMGAVTVGEARARQASLAITLDALGTVTPVTTVTVRPQVAGVMTEVLFTEGQMVKKDQVLARIDPRSYEQALMQAQGARVRDEAQLQAARVTLSRYQTLQQQDSIARQEVDTQAALVKQLEGTVITDRASEASAKLNLDYTRVTSPITGRVGLRAVDPGNYVAAGASTGIAVVTQITPIDVQFAVPQDRVPEIHQRTAQGAQLEVTALDRTRSETLDTGTFLTLDNVVDTSTGTVKAKARFGNSAARLFPNQFVNVRLKLRTVDALVVPVTALRLGPNGSYVYVIGDDRKVAMRPVTRGESTVDVVAITQGLQAGEMVVTEGGDRLDDGAYVQLQGEVPRAPPNGAAGGRHQRHPGGGANGGARPAAPAGGATAPGTSAPAATGSGSTGSTAPGTAEPAKPSPPPVTATEAGAPPANAATPAPAAPQGGAR